MNKIKITNIIILYYIYVIYIYYIYAIFLFLITMSMTSSYDNHINVFRPDI